jgi:hypothetical protein
MTAFRGTFERPGRRNGLQVWEWLPNDGAEQEIYRRIGDISLSMTADDWLQVPDQVDVQHFVKLDPADDENLSEPLPETCLLRLSDGDSDRRGQRRRADGEAATVRKRSHSTRIRRVKTIKELHDSKLEALQEILDSTEDPVIVFYNFKSDRERLLAYLWKNGSRES